MINRELAYVLIRQKMESAGFIFEKEQQPHFQNQRDKELKLIHPLLDRMFTKYKLKNLAKKFYVKSLSDDENSEIGLTTGKTSPLFSIADFPAPNAVDTYKNKELNAWVNRAGDDSFNRLLKAINSYLTPSQESYEEDFRKKVSASLTQSSNQRRERLKTALKKPEKITVTTVIYIRNPDVAAEVLSRAQGICENCHRELHFG